MHRGGCTSRHSPSRHPCARPTLCLRGIWADTDRDGPRGWGENFGVCSSERRGWFGAEVQPCWLCCSIPPALHPEVSVGAQMFSPARPGCDGISHQHLQGELRQLGLGWGTGKQPVCQMAEKGNREGKWEGAWRSAVTSQSHTAVWGGSQAPACSLSPLTCLLGCATRNKSIFSLPRGDGSRTARGDWHLSEWLWRKQLNP